MSPHAKPKLKPQHIHTPEEMPEEIDPEFDLQENPITGESELILSSGLDHDGTENPSFKEREFVYIGRVCFQVTDIRDDNGTIEAFQKTVSSDSTSPVTEQDIAVMINVLSSMLIRELKLDNNHIEFALANITGVAGSFRFSADLLGRNDGNWKAGLASIAFIAILSTEIGEVYKGGKELLIGKMVAIADRFWEEKACYQSGDESGTPKQVECSIIDTNLKPGLYFLTSQYDSAWSIAESLVEMFDNKYTIQQIALAIYTENVVRFGNSIDDLKVGIALRLPSAEKIGEIDKHEAKDYFEKKSD